MRSLYCAVLSLFLVIPVFSETSFSTPDINGSNEVLFTVSTRIPGTVSYNTLFKKSLDSGMVEQLTFFPEKLESLDGGRILQLRNRFGTARYDTRSGKTTWVEERKPFISGGSILSGVLTDVSTSPDGRWQVIINPETPARGRMILFDTSKGVRYVLAESVERGAVPVSWAPDSSVMVYEVDGTLYFARPESFFSVSLVDDKYRVLGEGTISCVSWYSSSRLIYITGTDVYRVPASELFARSLYSPLLGYGELAGKLPCPYENSRDSFAVSPDGQSILYSRGTRAVYYCPLEGDDYVAVTKPALLPWLLLSGNTISLELFWTPGNTPVVLAYSMEDGRRVLKAWKMADVSGSKVFLSLSVPPQTNDALLSASGALIAFTAPDSVYVYDALTWKEAAVYRGQRIVSAVWGDGTGLYIGGADQTVLWNFQTGSSSPLVVSAVREYGWNESADTVLAEIGSSGLFQYTDMLRWNASSQLRIRPHSISNTSWRLYIDSGKGYYANMLYARSTGTPGGTWALVNEPVPVRATAVSSPEPVSTPGSFSHGKRNGTREVALVFDAMDTLEGLPGILAALERYGIRATFFINGEFIRRNPAAVNEIVKAGHQCASLFYSTWDLSGQRFRIDEEFILKGLARNEDDFFNATGQELSLLWHAPYYVLSPDILSAGKKAGYRYIAPDVMVPDWVSEDQGRKAPALYRSASALVEDIVRDTKPGSIIPIRIGTGTGMRGSYLFDKIDQLINALIESGYSLVTVDTIIHNVSR